MSEIFVSTSIARRLMTRMQVTHERARISIFAGPPGIGKTTAIDAWRRIIPGQVAVAKIARPNSGELPVLLHAISAIQALMKADATIGTNRIGGARRSLFDAICLASGLHANRTRRFGLPDERRPPFSIVFDEAQNLSREAIEALRYWNDRDRCYAPYPIGLIFVGNSEFSLSGSVVSESVISAAVADRALYVQEFAYDELSDDDLTLVIEAHGVVDPDALALILRSFRGPRAIRSLRRILDLLDELRDEAGPLPVTAATVRAVLFEL